MILRRPARTLRAMDQQARVTVQVRGRVQGVGFRYWVRNQAARLGLAGSAVNRPDGSVEIVAQGERQACEQLLSRLRGGRTPGRVEAIAERWAAPQPGVEDFQTG